MKYISVQPISKYFIWQQEVFKYQFDKLGYDLKDSITVFVGNEELIPEMEKFLIRYPNTIIVPDQRVDTSYIPSIQLHGLYQLYKDYKYLIENDNIFLHDSDIVFTNKVDWDILIKKDKTVYCSDTISYVGAVYLDSKSPELTDRMAAIVGIDPEIVRANQNKSGGAQYILPTGLTYDMFLKMEQDCTAMYRFTSGEGSKYKKDDKDYPVQAWTASMHTILWVLWLNNIDTEVVKELEFSWPSWSDKDWNRVSIYHNAGVVNGSSGQFFKGNYIDKFPFKEDFGYVTHRNTCNWKYAQIIKEIEYVSDFYK